MRIGIIATAALKKQRTGIEEYTYQLIRNLIKLGVKNHQFILYTDRKQDLIKDLPKNFKNKILKWLPKKGWTQIRLSWEMLKDKPDILFVPAHTPPPFHPKVIVAIQGLEYEQVPKCYSFWQRKKLRFLTKRNAKKATKIIVPSECTKNDLIKFYKINPKKIFVIYHGI